MYSVDLRGAASAAHIYNKPIVAAESFTGGGYESSFALKRIADYWFTQARPFMDYIARVPYMLQQEKRRRRSRVPSA